MISLTIRIIAHRMRIISHKKISPVPRINFIIQPNLHSSTNWFGFLKIFDTGYSIS